MVVETHRISAQVGPSESRLCIDWGIGMIRGENDVLKHAFSGMPLCMYLYGLKKVGLIQKVGFKEKLMFST